MKRYHGVEVLVTGGNGFIGSRLVERLTFEGNANVTALVHDWRRATWVSRTTARLARCDIESIADVEGAVKGKEVVFHCVGIGGTPATCRKTNVVGTRHVIQACKKFGVKRLVYLSTVGVHGPHIEEGMNESAPFRSFGNPYADSKIMAEKLFWNQSDANQIDWVIIRPTYVWGPNSAWFTIKQIKDLTDGKFYLVKNGIGACNAVYVDNLVDIMLIAGLHPRAAHQAFLLTDGERLTWRQFWAYMAAMTSTPEGSLKSIDFSSILTERALFAAKSSLSHAVSWLSGGNSLPASAKVRNSIARKALRFPLAAAHKTLNRAWPQPYSPWDLVKYCSPGFIDISKAKEVLDYVPRVGVDEGMESCALWLREQNYL
jgi:nucleoside-diphosphate-sugar epimerase